MSEMKLTKPQNANAEMAYRVVEQAMECLPDNVDRQAFGNAVMYAMNKTFTNATQESVVEAVRSVCSLNLTPHANYQYVYFIPRRPSRDKPYEMKLEFGYKGLVKLARRGGWLENVQTIAFTAEDDWRESGGPDGHVLTYKLSQSANRTKDNIIAVGGYYTLTTGRTYSAPVMLKDELKSIELAATRGGRGFSPWTDQWHGVQMMCKSLVKRMSKTWDLEDIPQFAEAIRLEDEADRDSGKDEYALSQDGGANRQLEALLDSCDIEGDERKGMLVSACTKGQVTLEECRENEAAAAVAVAQIGRKLSQYGPENIFARVIEEGPDDE